MMLVEVKHEVLDLKGRVVADLVARKVFAPDALVVGLSACKMFGFLVRRVVDLLARKVALFVRMSVELVVRDGFVHMKLELAGWGEVC